MRGGVFDTTGEAVVDELPEQEAIAERLNERRVDEQSTVGIDGAASDSRAVSTRSEWRSASATVETASDARFIA